jgi:Flp pilus assembly protein TadD
VAVNHQRATFATNSGNMLLEKGQIADAITRYQEALSDDPNFADAHRQLAVALERSGRTAEAEAERKKATENHLNRNAHSAPRDFRDEGRDFSCAAWV